MQGYVRPAGAAAVGGLGLSSKREFSVYTGICPEKSGPLLALKLWQNPPKSASWKPQ